MDHLDSFYSSGVTSQAAQNAGSWEASQGYTPAAQKSYESYSAYNDRINAYNYYNSNKH